MSTTARIAHKTRSLKAFYDYYFIENNVFTGHKNGKILFKFRVM